MSERKTAEIKLRVTPTFKAGLQAAATAANVSMSEYIEESVQQRLWDGLNKAVDGTALIAPAVRELHPESEQALALERSVPAPFTGTPIPAEELLDADDLAVIADDADDELLASTCEHGLSMWQFCAPCYEASVTR